METSEQTSKPERQTSKQTRTINKRANKRKDGNGYLPVVTKDGEADGPVRVEIWVIDALLAADLWRRHRVVVVNRRDKDNVAPLVRL